MAIGGKKPKPTHLHVIDGTLNVTKHRRRAQEPKPSGSIGAPPSWMSEGQARIWREDLSAAPPGLMTKIDSAMFASWVVHREAFERAAAKVGVMQTAEFVVRGARGETVSAMLRALQVTATLMHKAAAELGFSPASRARVSVDDSRTKNPEDEFF